MQIKLRPYVIQETGPGMVWDTSSPPMPFFNIPRVDYGELLDSLRYPLIWSYDSLLQGYIPGEVDYAFLKWLQTLPSEFDSESLPPGRLYQLKIAGLIEPANRKDPVELTQQMSLQGYVKIPQLLDGEYTRLFISQYYWRNSHLIERHRDLEGVKRTSVNDLALMRLFHQLSEKLVQSIVPEKIKTSYSFTSAYESGSTLPAHTDRPQCVYNISMMLASQPRTSLSGWPLFIKHYDVVNSVPLEPGDAVIYSGTNDLHWRDKMPENLSSVLGVFFHYVPVDFTGVLK